MEELGQGNFGGLMVGTVCLMQLERWLERKGMAGGRDGSMPKSFACTGSFVNRWCTEMIVPISGFDHDHFCCCEDGCVASITAVLVYREERLVQI